MNSGGANKNSYLALNLTPETRELLSGLSRHIEAEASRSSPALPTEGCDGASFSVGTGTTSSSFDAMHPDQLHMTFFFAGEQLHALKADALVKWHGDCTSEVANKGQKMDLNTVNGVSHLHIRFRDLVLFPPGKNNLIVAVFDAPPELHALQASITQMAASSGIRSTCEPWLPHVTLGKIRASKALVDQTSQHLMRSGKEWIGSQVTPEGPAAPPCRKENDKPTLRLRSIPIRASVTGLELRGLTPRQRWMTWEMPFVPE